MVQAEAFAFLGAFGFFLVAKKIRSHANSFAKVKLTAVGSENDTINKRDVLSVICGQWRSGAFPGATPRREVFVLTWLFHGTKFK